MKRKQFNEERALKSFIALCDGEKLKDIAHQKYVDDFDMVPQSIEPLNYDSIFNKIVLILWNVTLADGSSYHVIAITSEQAEKIILEQSVSQDVIEVKNICFVKDIIGRSLI